ncbi:MAG TPA: response regulator [Steroidobacteraceae bacterium]|jgi:two-component system OmpR family response regulator|nr:response regulator [Steroidobacteraceae bacterium]
MNATELRTVLYIDDEPHIREIVQIALGLSNELKVHTGESGAQALELARELQPDVLLLDVMMPGLDGPATLSRMRADPAIAHIPVIFVTAKAMPREVALFRKMGAIGIIAKPFDPMQLTKQLRSLWEGHTAKAPPLDERMDKRILQREVTQLGRRFLERTRGEAITLHSLVEHAHNGDPLVIDQIEHLAHKIRGSGSMFGYAAVSACAGDLECLVEGVRLRQESAGAAIEPQVLQDLIVCTQRLSQAVEAAEST